MNVTRLFILYQGVPSQILQKNHKKICYAQKSNMQNKMCNLKFCNICYLFVFLTWAKEILLISLELEKFYFDKLNLLSYFGKKEMTPDLFVVLGK